MQIVKSPQEIRTLTQQWRAQNKSVGLVPTMGALHEGHLELCRKARQQNDKYVTSIFVNPTQFAPGEDYEKYFRPFERDVQLLEEAGCDAVFAPDAAAMYGKDDSTVISVAGLNKLWEGAARPTHFDGVTTVVAKLFHLVPAHRAYFGEKDYQQLKIIEQMVRDLYFCIDIIGVPIVRESDGLAKSSRNAYLSQDDRSAAKVLFEALQAAQQLAQSGEKSTFALQQKMEQVCARQRQVQLDYAVIVDAQTLQPLKVLSPQPARAIIAAVLSGTRLIDNCAISAKNG